MSNTLEKIGWSVAVGGLFAYMGGKVISEILAWRKQPPKPPAQPMRPFVSLADDPGYQASKGRWKRALEKQKEINAGAAGRRDQPGITRGPG